MHSYRFEVVIEKEAEDEGYFAWSPDLPGCVSDGLTVEDTRRNMREAITQHVAALVARGQAVPTSENRVRVEELTINLPA